MTGSESGTSLAPAPAPASSAPLPNAAPAPLSSLGALRQDMRPNIAGHHAVAWLGPTTPEPSLKDQFSSVQWHLLLAVLGNNHHHVRETLHASSAESPHSSPVCTAQGHRRQYNPALHRHKSNISDASSDALFQGAWAQGTVTIAKMKGKHKGLLKTACSCLPACTWSGHPQSACAIGSALPRDPQHWPPHPHSQPWVCTAGLHWKVSPRTLSHNPEETVRGADSTNSPVLARDPAHRWRGNPPRGGSKQLKVCSEGRSHPGRPEGSTAHSGANCESAGWGDKEGGDNLRRGDKAFLRERLHA